MQTMVRYLACMHGSQTHLRRRGVEGKRVEWGVWEMYLENVCLERDEVVRNGRDKWPGLVDENAACPLVIWGQR